MAASILALLALAGCARVGAAAPAPNIIFFLTDDQDIEMGSLAYMPKVQRQLIDQGATFTRMYAHVPVCCPSRSSLISGQFLHNNGCRGNAIATNCSSPAFQRGAEARSYVTDLAAAGYKTSFSGKYLNDYGSPAAGGTAHVPPGWTNWQGLVGNSVYYDYTLSNNGAPERHGSDYATDYLPNVILNRTLEFLGAHLGAAPVFAVLSTPSCHGPQTAAPQYQGAFPGLQAPRSPTYNATVAGTHWLQATHGAYTFSPTHAAFSDLVFRRRVQTLQTVDDIVDSVVAAVAAAGQLDNTYFVYTADNGYHTGAYGLVYDKRNAFETDTHLPMLIRGPGIAPGTAVAAPVSMTDLSATFLHMAGLPVPPHFDTASMLPFAQAQPPAPRTATYVEYAGEGGDGGPPGVCATTSRDNSLMCNPTVRLAGAGAPTLSRLSLLLLPRARAAPN
jgi:N-acetylglucosamine-6-sulfatase